MPQFRIIYQVVENLTSPSRRSAHETFANISDDLDEFTSGAIEGGKVTAILQEHVYVPDRENHWKTLKTIGPDLTITPIPKRPEDVGMGRP